MKARGGDFVKKVATKGHTIEAYNALRNNIQFIDDGAVRCIALTSATSNDGKTTVTLNLAQAFASAEQKTLLIDADMRNPSLHKALHLSNARGLSDVLREGKDVVVIKLENIPNLYFLSSGKRPYDPSHLLGSDAMRHFLQAMRAHFDMVIIDTPPVLPVSDACMLSRHVDGMLVVVRYGSTYEGGAIRTQRALALANANIVGVVLNDIPVSDSRAYGNPRRIKRTKKAKKRRQKP